MSYLNKSNSPPIDEGEAALRRSAPEIYLIDEDQQIISAAGADSRLDKHERLELWNVVANLLHQEPNDDDDVIGVAGSRIVRILPMIGQEGRRYCVLVERRRARFGVSEAAPRFNLTAREVEVLGLLFYGLSTFAIAAKLQIAETTTADHIKHIAAKTGSRNRAQIVARVLGF